MELNQLKCFRIVAETQNMTEAAERLHITQPTLSKVIRRLEEDLGVRLFDRKPSRLELNPFGGSFLVYVNQALDALERGKQYLETMQTGENQGIRLFSTFFGIPTMMVEAYVKQHSEVPVIESNETPENILTMLVNDHADFAMTLFPLDHPEAELITSIREPLLLLVPESMDPPEPSVRLRDYESARFGIFEGGKDLNSAFLRCCSEAHFVPNIVYRSTRSQIIHQLVNELQVCTLLPAHLVLDHWSEMPEAMQQRTMLVDEPKCYRTIYVYRRRQEDVRDLQKDSFAEFAQHYIQVMDRDISNLLMDTQF